MEPPFIHYPRYIRMTKKFLLLNLISIVLLSTILVSCSLFPFQPFGESTTTSPVTPIATPSPIPPTKQIISPTPGRYLPFVLPKFLVSISDHINTPGHFDANPKISGFFTKLSEAHILSPDEIEILPLDEKEEILATSKWLNGWFRENGFSGKLYMFSLRGSGESPTGGRQDGLLPIFIDLEQGTSFAVLGLSEDDDAVPIGWADQFFLLPVSLAPVGEEIGVNVSKVSGLDMEFLTLFKKQGTEWFFQTPLSEQAVRVGDSGVFEELHAALVENSKVQLASRLRLMLASLDWVEVGLSQARLEKWQVYADNRLEDLEPGEIDEIEGFVMRWEKFQRLLEESFIPERVKPAFRVEEPSDPDSGDQMPPILFIVDENYTTKEEQRLFLIARDASQDGIALVLATEIEGLVQRISPDGEYVEYVDEKDRLLLKADANAEIKSESEETYQMGIPRYFFEGMQASLYGLESISLLQIRWTRDAFNIFFNNPKYDAFEPYIWGADNNYAIDRSLEEFAGVASSVTRMSRINPKNVGNLLYFASTIAHEAAHQIQFLKWDSDHQTQCRLEIGDGTIPQNFWNWTAEEIITALESDQPIGAYHISAWMLNQLGQWDSWGVHKDIITTGRSPDGSLICQDES